MEFTEHVRIHKLSSSGEVLWTVSEEIGPLGEVNEAEPIPIIPKVIAVPLSGGCISQITSSKIIAFTSTGVANWEKSSFTSIRDITIGEDGAIYVLDNLGLHKLDADGNIIWSNTDVAIG